MENLAKKLINKTYDKNKIEKFNYSSENNNINKILEDVIEKLKKKEFNSVEHIESYIKLKIYKNNKINNKDSYYNNIINILKKEIGKNSKKINNIGSQANYQSNSNLKKELLKFTSKKK
jgi:hypothetical protein